MLSSPAQMVVDESLKLPVICSASTLIPHHLENSHHHLGVVEVVDELREKLEELSLDERKLIQPRDRVHVRRLSTEAWRTILECPTMTTAGKEEP